MAKYRIEISRDDCSGDGACMQEAPNTFELDDESIIVVLDPEGDSAEEVLAAAEAMPHRRDHPLRRGDRTEGVAEALTLPAVFC